MAFAIYLHRKESKECPENDEITYLKCNLANLVTPNWISGVIFSTKIILQSQNRQDYNSNRCVLHFRDTLYFPSYVNSKRHTEYTF